MVFSVAQSLNPKLPKLQKLVGAPKTFANFGFPCVFLRLSAEIPKTHVNFLVFSEILKNTCKFWIFSRNPEKHMQIFGFSAEILKNTWIFLDFQQKSKKTHGFFWIFSRNPKKHMEFCGFSAEIQAEASNTARITIMQLSCDPQRKLPQVEISIGDGIQDPRSKIFQRSVGRILEPD